VCAFPDRQSLGDTYALTVPGLDLTCELQGIGSFAGESLDCRRSSRAAFGIACVHSVDGSATVYIGAFTVVVAKPNHCIPADTPFGYTDSSSRPSYTFWRLP
jgi:hypothetical protein